MTTNPSTVNQFINRNKLRLTCDWADDNPNMDGARDMNHWKCVLKAGRKQMTFHFSQGYGISGEPDLASVLDCLASDAAGYENATGFEDWADEYGYDTDSRSAERTYNAVAHQSNDLLRILGDAAYSDLLWNTDRL